MKWNPMIPIQLLQSQLRGELAGVCTPYTLITIGLTIHQYQPLLCSNVDCPPSYLCCNRPDLRLPALFFLALSSVSCREVCTVDLNVLSLRHHHYLGCCRRPFFPMSHFRLSCFGRGFGHLPANDLFLLWVVLQCWSACTTISPLSSLVWLILYYHFPVFFWKVIYFFTILFTIQFFVATEFIAVTLTVLGMQLSFIWSTITWLLLAILLQLFVLFLRVSVFFCLVVWATMFASIDSSCTSHVYQMITLGCDFGLIFVSSAFDTLLIISGATDHMINNSFILDSLILYSVKSVQTANGTSILIIGFEMSHYYPHFLSFTCTKSVQ